MIIKTTLNIRVDLLELLKTASFLTGRSRHSIISMLLIRLVKDHDMLRGRWKRIHYQPRQKHGSYKIAHVKLDEPVYELLLDMKKISKESASALLARAIMLYCEEIIDRIKDNINYHPSIQYSIKKLIIDRSICWLLKWNIKEKRTPLRGYIT